MIVRCARCGRALKTQHSTKIMKHFCNAYCFEVYMGIRPFPYFPRGKIPIHPRSDEDLVLCEDEDNIAGGEEND